MHLMTISTVIGILWDVMGYRDGVGFKDKVAYQPVIVILDIYELSHLKINTFNCLLHL